MARGKFIVFEGPDSCGKSTIAKMTADWLESQCITARLTKHPGSTQVGKELRRISKHSSAEIPPICEGLINAAANNAFIELVLIPEIEKGTWVIGDRNNFISSLVYQILSGVSLASLDRIHDASHPDFPKIDMLFILRADDEMRAARQAAAGKDASQDRYESRKDYMEGVVNMYDVLAEEHCERLLKFVRPAPNSSGASTPMAFYVDANRPVDQVFDLVRESIEAIIPQRRAKVSK